MLNYILKHDLLGGYMKKIILLLVLSIFLVSACAKQNPNDLVGGGTPVPQQPTSTNQVSQQSPQQNIQTTTTNSAATPPTTPAPSNSGAQDSTSGVVKEFKMTAKQFAFEPSTIEVNKGDKVKLIVTSTDVPHGIAIPEYGINQRLEPGNPVTIEFTADKQGTFTAFCSVFCGSGHSAMKGKIIVK